MRFDLLNKAGKSRVLVVWAVFALVAVGFLGGLTTVSSSGDEVFE